MAVAGGRAQEQPLPAVHTLLVRDSLLLAGVLVPGTGHQWVLSCHPMSLRVQAI